MNKNTLELELAWLIKSLPKDYLKFKNTNIRQAYIESLDSKIKDIRIREKDGEFTYTVKYFVKSSKETGYTREENKKISKEEFSSLWNKTKKKIKKIRYFYPLSNGLTAEIDIYKDNLEGLIVVEVEFLSISAYQEFKVPDWFGKEVTDSKGIYPPVIADMSIEEVNKINNQYQQEPHEFE